MFTTHVIRILSSQHYTFITFLYIDIGCIGIENRFVVYRDVGIGARESAHFGISITNVISNQ